MSGSNSKGLRWNLRPPELGSSGPVGSHGGNDRLSREVENGVNSRSRSAIEPGFSIPLLPSAMEIPQGSREQGAHCQPSKDRDDQLLAMLAARTTALPRQQVIPIGFWIFRLPEHAMNWQDDEQWRSTRPIESKDVVDRNARRYRGASGEMQ